MAVTKYATLYVVPIFCGYCEFFDSTSTEGCVPLFRPGTEEVQEFLDYTGSVSEYVASRLPDDSPTPSGELTILFYVRDSGVEDARDGLIGTIGISVIKNNVFLVDSFKLGHRQPNIAISPTETFMASGLDQIRDYLGNALSTIFNRDVQYMVERDLVRDVDEEKEHDSGSSN